ncbi:MAG: lamin tail domain-containing protein [Planctomycetes bacterium]|nr:lamin tail domain-containing protein [Planctomycetota bacterium]
MRTTAPSPFASLFVVLLALAGFGRVCAAPLPQSGGILINEFCYDDSGVDDGEFVELVNASRQTVDISGWQLVASNPFGEQSRFTVPNGTKLAAGAYWVFGSSAVPRVDQVVGVTEIWDNAQAALVLVDPSNAIMDSVVYESWRSKWRIGTPIDEGVWPDFVSLDTGRTSWSRIRDGYDTRNARDFRIAPATPGSTNDLAPTGFDDDFDTRPTGSTIGEWGGSFAAPVVIDPTVVDANNPSKLPLSPQGGRAAVFWDSQGGGNTTMLLADGVRDVVVEAWVYIESHALSVADRAMWSIGVQGGTGSYYDFADVSGRQPQFVANGNTGISWTYEADDRGATLYLVDHGDGGWGSGARTAPVVLGKIALQPTIDEGWKRLRLEVRGNVVEGWFDGNYGCGDGQYVRGTTATPALGGVYIAYHERIAQPSRQRPFTCDQLRIGANSARVQWSGSGLATSQGMPQMTPLAPAMPGRRDFGIEAWGLVPNGASLLMLGVALFPTPLDLQVVGARQGCLLYFDPLEFYAIRADSKGEGSYVLPLPCLPASVGVDLHFQLLDFDPFLLSSFPVGISRLMTVTTGR